jgi:predicted metal-binding membrane protein
MGLAHGVFCLGCCWALMLLLFVGGVMNLLWIAAIAVFVLLEKVAPFGAIAGKIGSLGLLAGGAFVLLSGL